MLLITKNAIYDLKKAKAIQVTQAGLRIDYDINHIIPVPFPNDIRLKENEVEKLIDYLVENKDKNVKVKLNELLKEIKEPEKTEKKKAASINIIIESG